VENLDSYSFDLLYKCVNRFKSQEMLQTMSANDYPKLEQKSRRKMHTSVYKVAFPEAHKSRIMTMDDFIAEKKAMHGR